MCVVPYVTTPNTIKQSKKIENMFLQYLYWISKHFITIKKLTIVGRLLGLNPGIPGAPGVPHPPANTEQNIKKRF